MSEPVAIFEKEYYDRLKQVEARHWWTLGMTDIMSRLLEGELDGGAGKTFLDIGCGSGIGLAWAREHLPQARRLGIDISAHALEHCKTLGAELELGSAEQLPYAAGSVDLAICIDVLQHVPSDTAALAEAFRVLKPGGRFYVRTNARSLTPPPPGSRLYTVRSLERAFTQAGFRVARCSRVNVVGSLVAEVGMLRRSLNSNGHPHGDHHGHGHHAPQAFKGGGYGGGLRIEAEVGDSMASKLKRRLLIAEGQLIARGVSLPLGHSIVALGVKP